MRLICILFLCFHCCNSKIVSGDLDTASQWNFLARFCFLTQDGKFQFDITLPKYNESIFLYLYYDGPDQWPAVYGSSLSCVQKTSPPHIDVSRGQRIDLDSFNNADCTLRNGTLQCQSARKLNSARERWWYIVIGKCGFSGQMQFSYKLTMTNGNNIWDKQFSADEQYIIQVDITFLLLFCVVLVISIVCAVKLRKDSLLHATYKLYMASLVLEIIYLFIMSAYLGAFMHSGIEKNNIKTFAQCFEAASMLVFILMLILLAKGYTVTRGRLRTVTSVKIAVLITLLTIVYASVFIYEAAAFDPGKVLYTYASGPGYTLIALRLAAWLWFIYAIFFTLKHYPEKGGFYYPLFIFYTFWFWAGLIIVIVSNEVLVPWLREKVVNGIQLTITFIGYSYFLVLTMPCNANKNFPYHVRTTQIGAMENVPHIAQITEDAVSITHHTAPNLEDLFVTWRGEVPQHKDMKRPQHMEDDPPPYEEII